MCSVHGEYMHKFTGSSKVPHCVSLLGITKTGRICTRARTVGSSTQQATVVGKATKYTTNRSTARLPNIFKKY